MIYKVFSVFCKIVYQRVMANCCFMSNMNNMKNKGTKLMHLGRNYWNNTENNRLYKNVTCC